MVADDHKVLVKEMKDEEQKVQPPSEEGQLSKLITADISCIDANDYESHGAPEESVLPYSEKKKTIDVNRSM